MPPVLLSGIVRRRPEVVQGTGGPAKQHVEAPTRPVVATARVSTGDRAASVALRDGQAPGRHDSGLRKALACAEEFVSGGLAQNPNVPHCLGYLRTRKHYGGGRFGLRRVARMER